MRFPEFKNEREWEEKELDYFLDYLQPTPYLVESTDYNDKYKTPVLTAGKSFILGYTNEDKGIFKNNLPVIIFDDFTTATQFVDFPFKGKSSAMKILKAKKDADIKFSYESMQMIKYEVGVHQRHWISIFSKLKIPAPKLNEQQKISSCLSSLDDVIENHSRKLDLLKDHKKGLIQNLFPQEGKKVPKYRFPEFKKDGAWKIMTLGKISKITSGGTPNRSENNYWNGDIPWISTTLIDFNTINEANEYITEVGLLNSSAKIFPKGTILMAMYGQGKTRGKVGVLGIDAATNQACAAILLKEGYSTDYVFQYLAAHYDDIRELSNKGGQENLSGGLIEFIPLSIPNPKEQQKIASCLSSLDEIIATQTDKIEQLKRHKKGLMQGLFPKIED